MANISYIIRLRRALKEELRNMPLFQNGSAIVVQNEKGQILLQERVDKNVWGLPGGLQELGETFEEVAVRELKEETGLTAKIEDLILIKAVSGESRKNSYPNGDQVYNNTVLFMVKKYNGTPNAQYKETIDTGNALVKQKETKQLKFFDIDNLPPNLMDEDLINEYKEFIVNEIYIKVYSDTL